MNDKISKLVGVCYRTFKPRQEMTIGEFLKLPDMLGRKVYYRAWRLRAGGWVVFLGGGMDLSTELELQLDGDDLVAVLSVYAPLEYAPVPSETEA